MQNLDYSDFTDLFEAVTIFALRFDGYTYREDNKDFSDYKNYQQLMDGKEIKDEDLLPTLFFIQRDLAKGQHEPDSKLFGIFWALFLKSTKLPIEISEKYQNEEHVKQWNEIKKDLGEITKEAGKLTK
ncbi:MAG: hypothetical protein AN483_19595 [Aphanizomenon flos-aquae MDT14a]|jgi:hypothetical protein|uniref:Uncharacterized protein n=1 Tax=Aphanizomenon flos-aquae WA102 TaxID=1710896 RepID=A0A1B7X101_APHFL|nr:MAG: hypothetical protein AN483_19595 [Aphanizomenon flos-aquae MDT14a]OBQ43013.1 MAG: hypothetical protein AN484_14680 [Aphanizomenon flos-aquae WA102]